VPSRDNGEKSKVVFIYLEAEGSTPAIQESLHQIATSLKTRNAAGSRVLPSGLPPGRDAARKPGSVPRREESQLAFSELVPPEEDAVVEPSTPEDPPSARTGTSTRSQKRTYPQPKVVEGLEITSGNLPFKDFVQQKKPSGHHAKYLVIAFWLKDCRGMSNITVDHVYTCYRFMNWSTPPDMGDPFRKLKKKSFFISREDGVFSLSNVGENKVNEMSPK